MQAGERQLNLNFCSCLLTYRSGGRDMGLSIGTHFVMCCVCVFLGMYAAICASHVRVNACTVCINRICVYFV